MVNVSRFQNVSVVDICLLYYHSFLDSPLPFFLLHAHKLMQKQLQLFSHCKMTVSPSTGYFLTNLIPMIPRWRLKFLVSCLTAVRSSALTSSSQNFSSISNFEPTSRRQIWQVYGVYTDLPSWHIAHAY